MKNIKNKLNKKLILEVAILEKSGNRVSSALLSGGLSAGITGATSYIQNPDNIDDINNYAIAGAGLTGAVLGGSLAGTKNNTLNNVIIPAGAVAATGYGINKIYNEDPTHMINDPIDIPLTAGATAALGALTLLGNKR